MSVRRRGVISISKVGVALGVSVAALAWAGAAGCARSARGGGASALASSAGAVGSGAPTAEESDAFAPTPMRPSGGGQPVPGAGEANARDLAQMTDLGPKGAVAWGTTPVEIIDTRTMPQLQEEDPTADDRPSWTYRMVRDHLPPHEANKQEIKNWPREGPANTLEAGTTMDEPRTSVETLWPSINATGWNPPDPTLAVGPGHVVVAVNSSVAWYTKAGVQQFNAPLGSQGNPGFFEGVGGSTFCFDPKVVYDHFAQRFIVLVLEAYTSSNQAFVTIAVSDDSDPNGTWYKYRTDCVTNINGALYWWDYPGLGYDQNAWYVTSNLFAMSSGPYGGCGFRIFNKTPMLTGGTATYSTLREAGAYTLQPARHFGNPTHPYFTDDINSTTVRIYSILSPLTAPAIVSTNVTVPGYSGPEGAPTLGGGTMSAGGSTDPTWRNGQLYWCHNARTGSGTAARNVVRWHQFSTNTWPTSGVVTRVQSGDVDPGPGLHTMFPAIAANSAGDVAVVMGATGPDYRVSVRIAGRRATDPLGRMGQPILLKDGEANTDGRYGDYYHIAVDPSDDLLFWGIGEYPGPTASWRNWVASFRVSDQSVCHPVSDDAGVFQTSSATPVTIDVLANDWHSTGLPMTISSFSATSTRGGTITRSVGTGPGGRDRLTYTPPLNTQGLDSFNYTVSDAGGNPAAAAVTARLYNPATYRNGDSLGQVRAGVDADYYALSAPGSLPDFATLTPYGGARLANINYPNTTGVIAGSGRSDDVGVVFVGHVEVPATNLYTFYITSDDGSKVFLGGTEIINHDGLHGATEKASALIGLKAGFHPLRIEYFEAGGGAAVQVSMSSPSLTKAVIPASRWLVPAAMCTQDFNGDGDAGTDQDIEAFFACLGGNCCVTCGSSDFNNDGDTGTDQDIESFFRVLGGGAC
ncbi:MAG TPA: PA14 domain-containing protein [Phycisphaerales bacterium]|nr:PA14 domain-containing protein [Phycisphaerales bacterium]